MLKMIFLFIQRGIAIILVHLDFLYFALRKHTTSLNQRNLVPCAVCYSRNDII